MQKRKSILQIVLIGITIGSLITGPVYAGCPNAVRLQVGDTVQDCTRIGLSESYDKKVRQDLVEGDYNKKLVEGQKKLIEMKDLTIDTTKEREEVYKEETFRVRKELDAEKARGSWKFWGGLAGGVVFTILSVWAAGQLR